MKAEKLSDAIGILDDDILEEADKMRNAPKTDKKTRKPLWIGLAATAACAVIVGSVALSMRASQPPAITGDTTSAPTDSTTSEPVAGDSPSPLLPVGAIALASYPEYVQSPDYQDYAEWEDYENARLEYNKRYHAFHNYDSSYAEGMDAFFHQTMQTYLTETDGENLVVSPINLYMALTILAETTDGGTRQQILDTLGAEDVVQLREKTNALFKDNYVDSSIAKNITANSLWLDSALPYKEETLKSIAEHYYASSYSGDIGSKEFNEQLRAWLNAQTGGLLAEQAENVEMDPSTLFAIASTVYFNAKWQYEFSEKLTSEGTFHAADGDITCEFLHQKPNDYVWLGENYCAVELEFDNYNNDGGSMWIFLPDEGVSPEELAADAELYEFMSLIRQGHKAMINGAEHTGYIEIDLSLPKFDVSSDIELSEGLKKLGITDIFDGSKADFSAMLPEEYGGSLGYAQQAARVTIDEEGCTAASYTVIQPDGAAWGETDTFVFNADRPFLFVIMNDDDLPLFSGVVNTPIN